MGTICNKSKMVRPLHNPRNICFSSLSLVFLGDCRCLKELTFLIFAPNLVELVIDYGIDVEDIINKEKAEESGIVPFLKLNRLVLISLPKLKNIYWSPLLLPSLEKVEIMDCPNLKKLPLSSHSGKQGEDGLIILCEEEDGLKVWNGRTKQPKPASYLHAEKVSEAAKLKVNDAIWVISLSLSLSVYCFGSFEVYLCVSANSFCICFNTVTFGVLWSAFIYYAICSFFFFFKELPHFELSICFSHKLATR